MCRGCLARENDSTNAAVERQPPRDPCSGVELPATKLGRHASAARL